MKLFEIKNGETARSDTYIGIFTPSSHLNSLLSKDFVPEESFFSITKKWYSTSINQFYEYKKDDLTTICNKSNRLTKWLAHKLIDYITYCKLEQPIDFFNFHASDLQIGPLKNCKLTLSFDVNNIKTHFINPIYLSKHNLDYQFFYHLNIKHKGTEFDFLPSQHVITVLKKVQNIHSIFLKEIKASSFEDLKKIESLESDGFRAHNSIGHLECFIKRMDISCFFR